MEELCFLSGPCRDVISKGQGQLRVSSIQESVKRGPELEAIVGVITRKRLITD
jgi:hypothetical protein